MNPLLVDHLMCPRTGGPLALEVLEQDQEIRFGLLSSSAGVYPIVEGIPIFLPDHSEVVGLLQQRSFARATAVAAFGAVPRSRLRRVEATLSSMFPGTAAARLAERVRRTVETRAAMGILEDRAAMSDPLHLLRYAWTRSLAPSPDAFDYFAYRFSIPPHIVGLTAMETMLPAQGMVLDLGCGAGHLTWAIASRQPTVRVVGLDRSFFQLLTARRHIHPAGQYVCGDATRLPFRDGAFAALFSSDVLTFVEDKRTAVAEAIRVIDDNGSLAFSSLKNALHDHAFRGMPLTPGDWSCCMGQISHDLIPDRVLLESYFARRSAPLTNGALADGLRESRTLTIIASKAPDTLRVDQPVAGWPHARGHLKINPLYRPCDPVGSRRYERWWPSRSYQAEYPEMAEYLPPEATIPRHERPDIGPDSPSAELEPLLASFVVLGLPDRYPSPAWPVDG